MHPSSVNSSDTEPRELRSCEKPRLPSRDQDAQNARKSIYKKSSRSKIENEERQSKITKYINTSNSTSKPRITLEEISYDLNSKENRTNELEVKLNEKEEELRRIKASNEMLKCKVNESKEELRKRQMVLASTMLEIAEMKRNERGRVDRELGYYTDNCRKFMDGTLVTALKERIKEVERTLAKLEEDKKRADANSGEYICLLSSSEFKNKELLELKKELESKEREVAEYKERLRLVDKEEKSVYCIQGWPVIYEKYQTLQLLGSGGFGEVYKCYDLQSSKLVAIKKMKFDGNVSARHFQEVCKHIKREIEIQMRLEHPNIARLYRVLEIDEDRRCMVFELEYLMGPELSSYMKRHKFIEEKEAKIYIKQILCALNYLFHLKDKVIHYDLKPTNIIFHQGVIKILDFGLCKTIDSTSEETRIDLTSQGVGTYWYLPPETFDEDPKISSKVDVWSVGVIFYEMLYGRKPFGQGLSQSQIYDKRIILKATKVEFPADPSKKHKVSEQAKDFICACLKYEADERLSPAQAYEHPYLNIRK